MNINGIFPTPVVFFNLDRPLTEKENNFLLNQETHSNTGNTISKNKNILDEDVNKNLKTFIKISINKYFEKIVKPKYKVTPYITQSWINYTKEGEFHHKHEHPNSFISGVFYIKADKQKDKIHFFNNLYRQLKLPTDNYDAWNSDSWWFSVETGQLILFPSSLTHMVEPVKGDTRISLSFNTFLKGHIGNAEESTGLNL